MKKWLKEIREEKRVDPMATLLEGMGTLESGEQLWIQIEVAPVVSTKKESDGGYDFVAKGKEVRDKLAKRPESKKRKSIFMEVAKTIITGKSSGEEKEELKLEALLPVEARLTPGERDIVAGVEDKISKRGFKSYIRFIYLAKRDVYFGGAKAIPFSHFNQFATENLNALKPWPKTITKVRKYVNLFGENGLKVPTFGYLGPRRTFIKKRRLFFRYIKRFSPLFPRPGGTFILNTEELATIFHFPGKIVAPAPFVPRVESKRGEAPSGLPTE